MARDNVLASYGGGGWSPHGGPYQSDGDRPPGEPNGFTRFNGDKLDADPGDQHVCQTSDGLTRSQYDGNLYAYKVLIVDSLGHPRSYYKAAGGRWTGGWRDAECITSSTTVARHVHAASASPLPERCQCGFHCWYALPPLWESPRLDARTSVPVVVQIAGDILYADRGLRAQHVKVVAVVDCGNDRDSKYTFKHGRVYPSRAELCANFGNVPCLRPEDVYTWGVVEGLRPASERMQELMREVDE